MKKLNLETNCKEHEIIKTYLEEHASEELARKINAGVFVEQDGKQLVNKKTLNEFMIFAGKEAQNLAQKGVNCACIEGSLVFGWAIHYFEEESIIGTLYNPDGTKYKKSKPVAKPSTTFTPPIQQKPKHEQTSLFDLSAFIDKKDDKKDTVDNSTIDEIKEEIDESDEEEVEEEINDTVDNEDEEEINDTIEEKVVETKPKGNPIYNTYQDVKDSYVTSVIAMRLGDFYEIFGQDAVTIAKELDLTLIGRDCGLDHRIPMIGFPYHCADNYFDKIAENHSVIAIDTNGTFITSIPQKETTKTRKSNEEDVEKEFKTSNDSSEDDLQKETELMKAFDQESLIKLLDLFEENVAIG